MQQRDPSKVPGLYLAGLRLHVLWTYRFLINGTKLPVGLKVMVTGCCSAVKATKWRWIKIYC